MTKKIQKNNNIFAKQKYISKDLSLNKHIFYLALVFFTSCSIVPESYRETLIKTPWINNETINIGSTTQTIKYRSVFSPNGDFELTIDHPINGIVNHNYFYQIGYYEPKYAIVLYSKTAPVSSVVGSPIFYFFEIRENIPHLITATNANMSLSKTWIPE